jgi:hypothetical protein
MELQRFPEDYDGVLVGAPANDWSHLFAAFVWNELPRSTPALTAEHTMNSTDPDLSGFTRANRRGKIIQWLSALERWVEHGVAPERIVAVKYVNDAPAQEIQRTRPLCAYPKVAVYKGTGNTDNAANFDCRNPAHPDGDEAGDD